MLTLSIAAITVFGLLYMLVPAVQTLVERLINAASDTTMNSRVYFWEYAIMLWKSHPLFGIGFGCFPVHIATGGVNLAKYHYIQAFAAHNIYYQMLAEIGIIGLALFLGLFIWGLVTSISLLKKTQNTGDIQISTIILMGISCQIWFILYGLTGNPLYLPGQMFVYFFGLMIVSSVKNSVNSKNS